MGLRTGEESLSGKLVLVTGGSTGIGRATIRLLLNEGAKVVTCGRDEKALEEAMADFDGEVHTVVADLAEGEDIKKLFDLVDEKLGGLDILINNAAIAADSVVSTEYDEMLYIIKTNLVAYMACCHYAIPRLKERGHGDIINIGSMSAVDREEETDIYTATKTGTEGFSHTLRPMVAKDNIRVILIEPGLVGTDMTAPEYPPEKQREMQEKHEMLMSEDIAERVRFALIQPRRCDVFHMRVEPHIQTEE